MNELVAREQWINKHLLDFNSALPLNVDAQFGRNEPGVERDRADVPRRLCLLEEGFVAETEAGKVLPGDIYLRMNVGKIVIRSDALEIVVPKDTDYRDTSVEVLLR